MDQSSHLWNCDPAHVPMHGVSHALRVPGDILRLPVSGPQAIMQAHFRLVLCNALHLLRSVHFTRVGHPSYKFAKIYSWCCRILMSPYQKTFAIFIH